MEISDKRKKSAEKIKKIAAEAGLTAWNTGELLRLNGEVYEQLERSAAIGKVYQDLLLETMSPAELKKLLDDRMLRIVFNEIP